MGETLQETRRLRNARVTASAWLATPNLDKLVQDLLRKVRSPEAWQKDIERLVQNMDVVHAIENRRPEIDEEPRPTGRAFADGAFSEDDDERRRMKLSSER